MRRTIIYILWGLLLAGLLAAFCIFTCINKGWVGYVPPVEELENPDYKFASQIISADGVQLGTFSYSGENRVWVDYDELAPCLVQALIATEDHRFADHSGIDMKGLLRAIVKRGILRQKSAGGGSTLTQQLAKQLYSEVASGTMERLMQKPIEWVIAVKLERYYTKEEILAMYLNKYDFGNNAIGIKTAAYTYFAKEPAELSTEEAATLVGMCKNSSLYNPLRRKELTKERRNLVLSLMERDGYLTKEEADDYRSRELVLNYRRVDHNSGLAPYFREYLRGVMTAKQPEKKNYRGWQMQKWYEDSLDWATNPLYGWCNKNVNKDGKNYNVYTDGLKIHVTIDSRMQRYAEEAVDEHIKNYLQPRFFASKKNKKNAPYDNLSASEIEASLTRAMRQTDRYRLMNKKGLTDEAIRDSFDVKQEMQIYSYERGLIDTLLSPMDSLRYYKHFLRCGFMSVDPVTGHVKAYVGGPDFSRFQYDMATQGRRQIGSTVKPFLYTLAMENGFSPCDETIYGPQTLLTEDGRVWSPRDGGHASMIGHRVSLKWGLSRSSNWVSAYLMGKLNPYALKTLIHNFGVRNLDIQPTISLCLGPCDISVAEMVGAYTAFPNNGIRTEPIYVTAIEDADGDIVATFTPTTSEVFSRETSYKMIDMMRAVVDQGTGTRLRFRYNFTAPIAGKTGTTNSNSDGWFIGYVPRLVSGCWVGGDDRDIHFDSMRDGQGASMALPVWGLYMQKVYADPELGYSQSEKFNVPADFNPCASGSQFYMPMQEETNPQEFDDFFN
ncbi:MAG: transglycosylase domain-containing protein [Bacteroidaceae bacterium]|nr:transglycosylase domain-containing protein [Bacteroidaceae bacterium]